MFVCVGFQVVAPEDSYSVMRKAEDAALVVIGGKEPHITVTITLTSPVMREPLVVPAGAGAPTGAGAPSVAGASPGAAGAPAGAPAVAPNEKSGGKAEARPCRLGPSGRPGIRPGLSGISGNGLHWAAKSRALRATYSV